MRAVQFDNEPSLAAAEIDDELADRKLTAECETFELARLKTTPELFSAIV